MLKTAKQLSLRAKTLISLAGFAVVFAGLLTIATFYDLDISKLLTKHSLTPPALGQEHGSYISYNAFALFFEAVGSSAIYMMGAVVGAIVYWYFARREGNQRYIAAVGFVITVACFTLTLKDALGYVGEYIGAQLTTDSRLVLAAHKAAGASYVLGLCVLLSIMPSVGVLLLWQRIPKETNDKMIWWAIAIVATMAMYLVVHFVKSPIGRVRYRTMNYLQNFDLHTRWYEANGKQVLTSEGVVASTAETKANIIVASDACKSFPSGHSFSAGMVYALLGLPYVSEKCNRKGVKIGLWVGTVAFVGIVAFSRIVAGAHFMSDVLFGGTIAFVSAMLMREIFVCKGCHFFALFGIKRPVTQAAIVDQDIADVAENTAEIVPEVAAQEDASDEENA